MLENERVYIVTTATISTLPTRHNRNIKNRKARKVSRPSLAVKEGAFVLAVSASLLGLSLNHVAEGVEMITASLPWASWLMALGIEFSYVSLELAMLLAPEHLRSRVARFAYPAIVGTLTGSATLNAMSFASHSEGSFVYLAIGIGIAIPALVYSLSRVGAVLLTGKGK